MLDKKMTVSLIIAPTYQCGLDYVVSNNHSNAITWEDHIHNEFNAFLEDTKPLVGSIDKLYSDFNEYLQHKLLQISDVKIIIAEPEDLNAFDRVVFFFGDELNMSGKANNSGKLKIPHVSVPTWMCDKHLLAKLTDRNGDNK